jgi:hypothetical protein
MSPWDMNGDPSAYHWFLARVWPDARGVPSASIFNWFRETGRIGALLTTVHFGETQTFNSVMEHLGYEVVLGQVPDRVTIRGVFIALRKETVPARVKAAARMGAIVPPVRGLSGQR